MPARLTDPSWYWPAAHTRHASGPAVVLNDPAGHGVHDGSGPEGLYCPASQTDVSQGPPSGPENPVLQVQSVMSSLPEEEDESAGQSRHVTSFPAVASTPRYFPAVQVDVHEAAKPGAETMLSEMKITFITPVSEVYA
eukprot:3218071-Rhodomonas_salina.1